MSRGAVDGKWLARHEITWSHSEAGRGTIGPATRFGSWVASRDPSCKEGHGPAPGSRHARRAWRLGRGARPRRAHPHLLLLGVLQFGLFVRGAPDTRQGVRDTARQGATGQFGDCAATDADNLRCTAHDLIAADAASSWVMVTLPDGWERGDPLLVCAMVSSRGGIGLVPLPDNGLITAKTQMSIEFDAATSPTGYPLSDTPPADAGWGWCA